MTAAIFAIEALQWLDYRPAHDLLVSSVIGEESGGVGALTTIVKGVRADGVVVLEPTNGAICPVQAGALTFRLTVQGRAAHGAAKIEGPRMSTPVSTCPAPSAGCRTWPPIT